MTGAERAEVHESASETADASQVATDAEHIVARLRPHGRVIFWPSIALIAIMFGVGYYGGRFEQTWQNMAVLGAGAVLATLLWMIPMMSWLAQRYIITTRRIVVRRGLIVRHRQEVLHSRGLDISVRQGAFQRMVGSGDVFLNTGSDMPIRISDVPVANLVQSTLHDLAERSMNPIAARRYASEHTDGHQADTW